MSTVKSALKIASVGFIWGLLEASVIFLSLLLLGGPTQVVSDFGRGWSLSLGGPAQFFSDFGPGWRPVLLSELVVSFAAGAVLADSEDTLKALLVGTALAFGSSIIVESFVALPISVGLDQTSAELIYFTFLAPASFFVGLIAGVVGSFFGDWLRSSRQPIRPLPPLH